MRLQVLRGSQMNTLLKKCISAVSSLALNKKNAFIFHMNRSEFVLIKYISRMTPMGNESDVSKVTCPHFTKIVSQPLVSGNKWHLLLKSQLFLSPNHCRSSLHRNPYNRMPWLPNDVSTLLGRLSSWCANSDVVVHVPSGGGWSDLNGQVTFT